MDDKHLEPNDISIDTLITVLTNEHRRIILAYLLQENDPALLEDLIDCIVREFQPDGEVRQNELRTFTALKLQHVHLPLMDDVGIIEYDTGLKTVEGTDATELAKPYLEFVRQNNSK
jgi:hypothetical protein